MRHGTLIGQSCDARSESGDTTRVVMLTGVGKCDLSREVRLELGIRPKLYLPTLAEHMIGVRHMIGVMHTTGVAPSDRSRAYEQSRGYNWSRVFRLESGIRLESRIQPELRLLI
jgi:hypothetical protein